MKHKSSQFKRFISLFLLLAIVVGSLYSFSACKKQGESEQDQTEASNTPSEPAPKTGEFSFDLYAMTLPKGTSATITATVDASGLHWSTSDPSVATVSNGVVTGVKAGTAEITAYNDVDRALCRVTVTETVNEVPALSLSADAISLFLGRTYDLTPALTLSDGTIPAADYTLTCRSGDTTVATVEQGVITAVGRGNTIVTISATYGSYYYERTVAVTVNDISNYIVLGSDNIALCYGDTVAGDPNTERITAPLDFKVYRNNVRQDSAAGVTFSSSDPAIVTIDNEGILTAHSIGRATVTAEFLGDSYPIAVTVGMPIASPGDLNALANAYRNAEDKNVCPALWKADQIFVLAHDIDFHGASFYAIASSYRAQDGDVYWWRSSYQTLNAPSPYQFSGTIDGAGYSIKNMTLAPVIAQWSQLWYKGANFIGYMAGTLRNISFINLTIGEKVSDPIQDVGLFHNICPGATVENVYIQATVNAGQFAGNGAVLAGYWYYDGGAGNTITVKNCIVNAEYADGWQPVDTYNAVSKRLGVFVNIPNGGKKANITGCYLISSTFTEAEMYSCDPYFSLIYPDVDTFADSKSVNAMRNEGFEEFIISHIHPSSGYTVRHYISAAAVATTSDTLYVEEVLGGEIGEMTAARARTIPGFIAPETIEQQIIGDNTVINIFYRRDMLVDTLEQMPTDGNYSYREQGIDNTGKVLLLDGEETPYSMGYHSLGVWITTESHGGTSALKFKKDGYDTHTMIYVHLTEQQIATVQAGGGLSFWYKSAGLSYFEINDVDIGAGASDWTKVTLTSEMLASVGECGMLKIKLYNTWYEGEMFLDDITVFAVT